MAEQLELQSQLDGLLDLQTRGVFGLDKSIQDFPSGHDWTLGRN